MAEMINGYPCQDCADVALARRNINPAKPQNGPFELDSTRRIEGSKALGRNLPLSEGPRGTKINLLT